MIIGAEKRHLDLRLFHKVTHAVDESFIVNESTFQNRLKLIYEILLQPLGIEIAFWRIRIQDPMRMPTFFRTALAILLCQAKY